MKYQRRVSLGWLCQQFKYSPHNLQESLKYCTYIVEHTYYDGYYKTICRDIDSLDDVVKCINELK